MKMSVRGGCYLGGEDDEDVEEVEEVGDVADGDDGDCLSVCGRAARRGD